MSREYRNTRNFSMGEKSVAAIFTVFKGALK
jgi:hypothetical protein